MISAKKKRCLCRETLTITRVHPGGSGGDREEGASSDD